MKPVRVTEVLNYFIEPWQLDWYAKNGKAYCNRVGKSAMKIGSTVDLLIKEGLPVNWNPKKVNQEVLNCLEAYEKWKTIYKPKSITPCTRLNAFIEGVEVTGEPDIMVDDVLVDIKCSTKISLKYWVQVNMYMKLSLDTTDLNLKTPKVGILRLDKITSSYEYVVKDYDPFLVRVWCGLLDAYVAFNKEELENDGDDL